MTTNKRLHRFDTGFVPTANRAGDYIIVTRNSPLISCVSRQRPGQYRVEGGLFIGGGASHDATPEEAAEHKRLEPFPSSTTTHAAVIL
jgi:hypothetical protein